MATSKMTIGTLQHLKVQKLYNIKIIVSALLLLSGDIYPCSRAMWEEKIFSPSTRSGNEARGYSTQTIILAPSGGISSCHSFLI